jgi:spermidine synthase
MTLHSHRGGESAQHERILALVLFTASGASGLMLEIVWSRMLGWLLGATTWSVMTVLVAFMGGLGLGGILWGNRVARSPRALRLFGLMELSIGLYSLAVPILFEWLGRSFVAVTHLVGDSPGAGIALRVVTSGVGLAPPTMLTGGTLPVLTRFLAMGHAQPGRAAGWLYAANTAGAVVGCALTGCVLIRVLGVVETNIVAAVVDLLVGAIALVWDRRLEAATDGGGPAAEPAPPAAMANIAIMVATASGFCGLAYELLWTRGLLAAITDDTTYAFTLMLTAFLAGHASGAALAGRTGRDGRVADDWRRLGAAQMLASFTALLSLPLLVVIHYPINRPWLIEGMSFWGARVPFHLAISLAVFAPAAAFLGASFSLAARLCVGPASRAGASIGRLYGLNTLGSIAGAIITTALLVPSVGTQGAIGLLAILQAAVGALVVLACGRSAKGWRGEFSASLTGALLVAGACGLNRLLPMTAIYAAQEPGKLVAVVEGAGAVVTVHQRSSSDRVISINGVNVAGTNPVLRTTQKLQAHLPVCLHRAPRSVLQIGFGSGATCYSVSLHPEVESIDVVDLNPDVLKVASEWFTDVNHHVLDDPRVRVRIVDAKSHVAATERTYDLILSDSTHPRFRGNAALYARDYIANCSRRLRPGGLLSTWLPLYGMSVDDVRSILKSFQSVFPHVTVWYPNFEPQENTIVIASLDPIRVDPAFLSRRITVEPIAADLTDVGITSTIQLLDFFMLGDRAVADFSRPGWLNTDDHPRLEFLAPLSMRRKQSFMDNFEALRQAREPLDTYLTDVGPAERAQIARWYAGTTWKLAGQSFELEARVADTLEAYSQCLRLNPEDSIVRNRLAQLRKVYAPP